MHVHDCILMSSAFWDSIHFRSIHWNCTWKRMPPLSVKYWQCCTNVLSLFVEIKELFISWSTGRKKQFIQFTIIHHHFPIAYRFFLQLGLAFTFRFDQVFWNSCQDWWITQCWPVKGLYAQQSYSMMTASFWNSDLLLSPTVWYK